MIKTTHFMSPGKINLFQDVVTNVFLQNQENKDPRPSATFLISKTQLSPKFTNF